MQGSELVVRVLTGPAFAACLALTLASAATAQTDPAERLCGELASSPYDSTKVGAGVRLSQIDTGNALAACAQAVQRNPTSPRNQIHYGRALEAAKRFEEAAFAYRKAGDAGGADGFAYLAALFLLSSPPNYEQAFQWNRKSAQGGSARGYAALGWHYHEGKGVAQDLAEAFRLLNQAAQRGSVSGMYQLGLVYLFGDGVKQSNDDALTWLRAAADKGSTDAQHALAKMYLRGYGVARDEEAAFRWYLLAARGGDPSAQFWVGAMLDSGRLVPRDEATAVAWYRKAAAQKDPDAMTQLGLHLREGRGVKQDEREAMEWFGQAAAKRNPEAQFALGWGFMQGLGGERQDYWQAGQWFSHAAAQGSAAAQLNLGILYQRGLGVKPDAQRAKALFEQAARSPNPDIANTARSLAAKAASAAPQSALSADDRDALLGGIAVGIGLYALWELFGGSDQPAAPAGKRTSPGGRPPSVDNSQRTIENHIQSERSAQQAAATERQERRNIYEKVQRCGFNANANCF